MKKQLKLCLLILFSFFFQNSVLAQNKLKFENLPNEQYESFSKQFKEYKICSLNQSTLVTLNSGEDISIQLDRNYNFVLEENRIFSSNYLVSIKDDNGIQKKSLQELGFEGRFYRNADSERDHILCLSSYKETYSIYVKANGADFYIEPLKKYSPNAKDNEYIYYESKNVIVPEGVKLEDDIVDKSKNENRNAQTTTSIIPNCKTLDVVIAVDYSLFQVQGSNINLSIYYSASILNLTEANYSVNKGLSQDIHFKIAEHRINTTSTCNFWPITTGAEILGNFGSVLDNNLMFSTSDYDIPIYTSLFQSQNDYGFAGISTYDNLCSNSHGSLISLSFLSSALDSIILSHEIGHYFGYGHDPIGSPTIMAPSVTSATIGWSSASINLINSKINTGACFSTCTTDICEAQQVPNLNYSINSVNHTITVSWSLFNSEVNYKVRLYDFNTNSWTPYSTINYPNNSYSYNYTQVHCLDKYKLEIIPICSNIFGTIKQIAFDVSGQGQQPTIHIDYNILPENEGICVGLPSFYIANGLDWGTSPTFQWKKNGVNVGLNQNTLSVLAVNGDVITCSVISSDTCVINPNASSNTITVNLAQPVTPTVSFVSNDVCSLLSSSGQLFVESTNTGLTPSYVWYVNNVLVPEADFDGEYFFGTINNGDVITVVMTSSLYFVTSQTATANLTINCDVTLNANLFIEGYYIGNHEMTSVLLNQGVPGANPIYTDDIVIELRDPTDYHLVATQPSILTKTGLCQSNFLGLPTNASYYIVVKHRNAIQTWSAQPVLISGFFNSYDFTTASSQAYGNNMIEVEPGVWAFYSGDINQDEVIDNSDTDDLINDIINSAFGYYNTDLNGDGVVDGSDSTYLYNNITNSIYSVHP